MANAGYNMHTMNCHGCGKSVAYVYQTPEGAVVCIDCQFKMQQVNEMGQRSAERMINYLTGEMEAVTGISTNWPRFPEPKPPVHMHNPTVNSLQISDSVIGAVNQGYVESMNVALTNVSKDNVKAAQLMKVFSDAILSTQAMAKEDKEALLQHLSYLTGQLKTPNNKRPLTVIAELSTIISAAVTNYPVLNAIWEKISGLFT